MLETRTNLNFYESFCFSFKEWEKTPREDPISPFPAESRNGSTPISTFQRMTSCALAKTAPVGDDFQLAALRSTDDDDDSFVSCELQIGV